MRLQEAGRGRQKLGAVPLLRQKPVRWFRCLVQMTAGSSAGDLEHIQQGGGPEADPGRDGGTGLRASPHTLDEVEEVDGKREVWGSLL